MARWAPGAGEIDDLLTRHRLERVHGARADGAPWLEKAQRRLGTAEAIVSDDLESAFVLAYDAARFVGEALLGSRAFDRPKPAATSRSPTRCALSSADR